MVDLDLPESAFGDGGRGELPASRGDVPPPEAVPPATAPGADLLPSDLASYLAGVERDILVRALARHRCNRTAAGASLGLSLRQMRYRMARVGVQVADHGLSVGANGGDPDDEP